MKDALNRTRGRRTAQLGVPRTSLRHLCKQRKFGEILRILDNDGIDHEEWLGTYAKTKAGTALHMLVAHRPPVKLVDVLIWKMVDLVPSTIPEDTRDNKGRTPLHIAAACGCARPVIERLLEGVSAVMPAVAIDDHERLPLHWACANPNGYQQLGRRRRSMASCQSTPEADIANMVNVVCALIRAYPEAAMIADLDGMTPMDLAKKHFADRRMVSVLEAAVNWGATKNINTTVPSLTESIESSDSSDVPQEIFDAFKADDVSTIGWCRSTRRLSAMPSLETSNEKSLVVESRADDYADKEKDQPVYDPNDKNTPDVIEKCWFL